MKIEILISFIIGYLFNRLVYWTNEPIRKYWRKKCNYNCEECKVWDCEKHYCDYEKQKKEVKNDKCN